jgi:5'-3' exonuclease
MDSFLNMISILRYNEVHTVFVYDTKAPPEKDNERKLRFLAREKNKKKNKEIIDLWEDYKLKNNISDKIYSIESENVLSEFIKKILQNENKEYLEYQHIEYEIEKLKNSLLNIRTEDFNLTKEFFKVCNIPIINAETEAELTCANLVKEKKIAAVLTEDTDVLAYGCPYMLHKMDIKESTFIEIDYEEILTSLELTSEQFLDFCIMCGTDYNQNIPKIGPEKAYKLIQQYKTIENIKENNPLLPIEILNHIKIREIFNQKNNSELKIPYCGFPNKELLSHLYFVNNCKFNINELYNSFEKSIFHKFEEYEIEKKKHLLCCD